MAAEGAGEPDAGRELADLRHLVHGVAHRAGPGVLDLHVGELRIDPHDVAAQKHGQPARRREPRGDAAAPHQAVPADHAVVIAGAPRVGDRAGIGNGLGEPLAERRRSGEIACDRNNGSRDRRKHRAEMRPACEYDVVGAHAAVRRVDALAHAQHVEGDRGRILIDARTGTLGSCGEAERIIERMHMEGLRQVHRLIINLRAEHLPHLFGRACLGVHAEVDAQHRHEAEHRLLVVAAPRDQPPVRLVDAGHVRVADRRAHVIDTGTGERP